MCFVRGRILGNRASSNAPELSSNTLHLTSGGPVAIGTPLTLASSKMSIRGSSDLNASEIAMYSASVVLKAASLCNFDPHNRTPCVSNYESCPRFGRHCVKVHAICSLDVLPQEVCINPTLKRLSLHWVQVYSLVLGSLQIPSHIPHCVCMRLLWIC
jgi:hypothetical protein